jgi:hypothetical protein
MGIPRYILGRAVLEAKDTKEAIDILTMAPRAYPYHHNIGSLTEKNYFSVETTPATWQVKEPQGIYYHTNHLLFEKTKMYKFEEMEYKNTSSISRFKVVEKEIKDLEFDTITPANILSILSSHQNAPFSPCRHPLKDVKGITLATTVYDNQNRRMRLYKGNPCQAVPNDLYVDFTTDMF